VDRFTYEKVRANRPELKLPAWRDLWNTDRHKAKRMSVPKLVAERTRKLLVRQPGIVDRPRKCISHEHPYVYKGDGVWEPATTAPVV
jgi:hypothetical protein